MKKILVACAVLLFTATACPVDPPATNYALCPVAGAGQIQVAVVVEGTANPAHEVVCVVVANGASTLDALDARSTRLGTTPRRMHPTNGLLCAIDGVPPAPSCGDSGPAGFSYWNYSHGGAAWAESMVGPADYDLAQGDVEGFNFGTWDFVTTFPTGPTHSPSFATLTAG